MSKSRQRNGVLLGQDDQLLAPVRFGDQRRIDADAHRHGAGVVGQRGHVQQKTLSLGLSAIHEGRDHVLHRIRMRQKHLGLPLGQHLG